MKQTKNWIVIGASILFLASCDKNHGEGGNPNIGNHVYTSTNATHGNVLLDYKRANDGTLTLDSSYPTAGVGTGAGLGSQGSVTLADNGIVLVVNAGSNTISSFKPGNRGLVLQSTIGSGGIIPISIAAYNNTVFVLNSGGSGNISGFNMTSNGKLSAIANSTYALSTSSAGPAEVAFVNNGNSLVVTEKNNNKITSFTSNGTMHTLTSANTTPFGFAVGSNGNIYVSEAAGGAANASTVSSYYIDNNGVIKLVTEAVSAHQTSACWVVLTGDEKYAFASNTASNNMSSFNVNRFSGAISVNKAIAATSGSKPGDAALSSDSKYLYVLTPGSNTISSFKTDQSGGLTSVQSVSGIAGSGAGMAAN